MGMGFENPKGSFSKRGVDIHILQGLVTKLESEAHTAIKWTISQVITELLLASAVFGRKLVFLLFAIACLFSCI